MTHSTLLITVSVLGSILGGWLGTKLVRNQAESRSILDLPNDRSLHQTPTPRGGGLAIVVVVLVFLVFEGTIGLLPWKVVIGIGGGGAAVALVGWLDDVYCIPPLRRLLVHFAAALWAVAWLGGFRFASLGIQRIDLGIAGSLIAVIGIAWATNLFNFMDGSDGIVAVEVISIGAIGGALLLNMGSPGMGTFALVLAGAALGFVWWNWDPARIFLGDVGSGFVGFTIAALAMASENSGALPVTVWVLLSGVFVVDATITLIRRFQTGHWREPHRTHAYQIAVQAGWSHAAVATRVGTMNLVLGALGVAAVLGLIALPIALATAFLLCTVIYIVVVRRYSRKVLSKPPEYQPRRET